MSSRTFVMKVLIIAALSVVGARELEQAIDGPGYYLSNIERYWTECPTNEVLYTPNQSEPTQMIELKKVIDAEHPLLITAKVINKNTGAEVYNGKDLNICIHDEWDRHTWYLIAIRFFKVAMMPMDGWHNCPIKPERYEIHRRLNEMLVFAPTYLPDGNYEIWFTAKSDDDKLVFSTLKFKFVSKEADLDWS